MGGGPVHRREGHAQRLRHLPQGPQLPLLWLDHLPRGPLHLWDSDKNQGCLCDPGFTGHDCSQRECGWGADPLDSQGEDYTSSVTSTSVSSFYTKTAERQTLDIDSSCGTVSGTFSLTHTDKVNREKTTTVSIQVSPELSSTVEVNEPEAYDSMYCTTT